MQTPKPHKSTQVRRVTICRHTVIRSGYISVNLPMLRLCGKWLQDCGFQIGHVVNITCKKGRLVITIVKEQKHIEEKT